MPIFTNMEQMPSILEMARWLMNKGGRENLEIFFYLAWDL